jgi:phosphate transport system substrate-binding protein
MRRLRFLRLPETYEMSLRFCLLLTPGLLLVLPCGCGAPADGGPAIRNEGSDTMVNIAEAWAEQYHQERPTVRIQVLGGGSGVGIASLIDGNCDMANTSRRMKKAEIDAARNKRGGNPKEIIVGHDALAIYVHKQNPLDSISLEELADLYGEDGKIAKWTQLGVPDGTLGTDQITRVNRQSGSGTYAYFREAVLGKGKDLKLASVDANGSKDAVSLVAHTPSAIGYSGMGYATPDVKTLRVSRRRGEPGVAPTVENARNGSYPITRPLQIYVIGEPAGTVKEYLDWILSPRGQKIVLELGYVPARLHENP